MKTFKGLCPHCAQVGDWQYDTVSIGGFPPTGGDYEWAEFDSPTICPHCGQTISVRIQADIATSQVNHLVSSPMPGLDQWQHYVVALVRKFAEDMVVVEVMAFAETEDEAEVQLKAAGGGYEDGYESRIILILDQDGYRRLDGQRLHESANHQIDYF